MRLIDWKRFAAVAVFTGFALLLYAASLPAGEAAPGKQETSVDGKTSEKNAPGNDKKQEIKKAPTPQELAEQKRQETIAKLNQEIEQGDGKDVGLILLMSPELVNETCEGRTPLHRAVDIADHTMIEILVKAGANAGIADDNGRTPLHNAAASGDAESTRLVAKSKSASAYKKDAQGKTALDLATDPEVKRILQGIHAGMVPDSEMILEYLPRWMHPFFKTKIFGVELIRFVLALVIILFVIVINTVMRFYIAHITRKQDRKEGIETTEEEAQSAADGKENLADSQKKRSFVSLSILASRRGLKLLVWGLALEVMIPLMLPSLAEETSYFGSIVFSIALAVFFFDYADVLEYYLNRYAAKTESKLDDMLVPMFKKGIRILIVVIAGLQLYQTISGNSIATVIAGLGIGSMAIALAATDTLKNLIGFVMILLDKPYMVGERITFDGHDGVIEKIGMRTTRMRRLDGHVVSIPNSKAVDSALHNIGRRPYIKRVMDITVTYDTPIAKIEKGLEIVKDILKDHPGMDPELTPRVYFSELNADSLSIMAIYWFHPADYWAYMDFSQHVNLELMKRFEEEGIEFAFPTQTLYLAGDPARALNINHPGLEDALKGMAGGK